MARYADNLLADGERAVLRTRQHWLATIFDGRTAWAIFIASVVLFFLSGSVAQELARQVFQWIALALLVVSLFWLLQVYASWYAEDYMVTNRRVIKVEGVFRKRSADSSLEKINDAVLEQSVLGRMLGYGDLEILTAAETSVDTYQMLAGAPQFKKTMLDEKHSLEEEFLRVPAPPLRAAPVMAPVPSAAPPPAEPTKPGMTSTEITKALGELADLRDRGAISAED
ncbi:MAG TPA: PH domain-containing protein, partial [Candidatus Limnocylindrales bacterium]|nr:PH domain-containing protein [Candidatus Limnocylindrales bacterium]